MFQTILTWSSLCFATLALLLSMISLKRSNTRLVNAKLSRTIAGLDIELAELHDVVTSLTSQMKRLNARQNMRRAREKSKENKEPELTDDEWRAQATKQLELGRLKL